MAFVKLECGMVRSSIWFDKPARDVFITALLLAEPRVIDEPMEEIATRELRDTGYVVPPGRYGFVPAASVGIIALAGVEREAGLAALERLAAPDPESRSKEFDGRRLVRVNGGFLALTYAKHRDKDLTAAERQRRWRERQKQDVTPSHVDVTPSPNGNVTDVEGDVEGEGDVEKIGSDSSEPAKPASKPPGTPAPGLLFETVGKGPRTFQVTREQLADWGAAYPGVDVATEARKALEWTRANPANRKTAKGMPAFLLRWFGKAQDSAPRSQVRQTAAVSPYCEWHQKAGTARKRSLSPKAGCPECRNVEVVSRHREGKPQPVSFDFLGGTDGASKA